MDEIDELIKEFKANNNIKKTRFTRTLINETGKIYEIHGYGAAKMFLLSKQQDRRKKREINVLLNILEKINQLNYPQHIGGFIIRKIDSIVVRW